MSRLKARAGTPLPDLTNTAHHASRRTLVGRILPDSPARSRPGTTPLVRPGKARVPGHSAGPDDKERSSRVRRWLRALAHRAGRAAVGRGHTQLGYDTRFQNRASFASRTLCRQLGSPTTAHERRASRGTRSRQGAGASRIRASNPTEAVVRREPHRLLLGNEREHVARADQPLRRHARIRSEGGASGHRIGASALPLRGEGGARRVPPWAAAARPLQERRPRSSAALLALRMRQSASCSAPVCPFIGCTLAARIAS
jgi:hypothetical protein